MNNKAMTLIELLVVISIILILAAMISYGLNAAKGAAARTQCLANIRSLGQAAVMYAEDDKGSSFPAIYDGSGAPDTQKGLFFGLLYSPTDFNDLTVYVCPSKNRDGTPDKPAGITPPFAIMPITKNSYRFVLNSDHTKAQNTSFPATNIIVIENFTIDATTPSLGYTHDTSGIAAYQINGKCRFIGGGNKTIDPNTNPDGSTYAINPDATAGNLAS